MCLRQAQLDLALPGKIGWWRQRVAAMRRIEPVNDGASIVTERKEGADPVHGVEDSSGTDRRPYRPGRPTSYGR